MKNIPLFKENVFVDYKLETLQATPYEQSLSDDQTHFGSC